MQIPSNPYPIVRTPPALVPRRDEVRAGDEPESVPEAAQAAERSEGTPSSTAQTLSADMQQAALRGRPTADRTPYANQQALAEYADAATRAEVVEGTGQIELQRFDAYV